MARVRFSVGGSFYLLHSLQTGSGARPSSYPMDTGGSFPGGWYGRFVTQTAHLHLVPRSRMVELYLHSPRRLHGVVLIKHGATSPLPYHTSLQKSSPVPWGTCFFAFCRHDEFNWFHISTFSPILVLFLILHNVRILDHFWPPVVRVTPLKTPFGLLIRLLQAHPHVTTFTQLFLTLCHIYTAYNLTRS
jgi:hypothetical protein